MWLGIRFAEFISIYKSEAKMMMIKQVEQALIRSNLWDDLFEFRARVKQAIDTHVGWNRRPAVEKICKEYYA